MSTSSSSYPTLPALKALYPQIGVSLLGNGDENGLKGHLTIDGKRKPFVVFTGSDRYDLEGNVYRVYHWEKTNKVLPVPFVSKVVDIKTDTTIKCETKTNHCEVKANLQSEMKTNGNKGKLFYHNNSTGERVKIDPDKVSEYKAKGFEAGKLFAPWADKDKIEAARKAREAAVAYVPKSDGPGRGAHFIGKKWIKELSTGIKSRVPEADYAAKIASGKFIASGPRAK